MGCSLILLQPNQDNLNIYLKNISLNHHLLSLQIKSHQMLKIHPRLIITPISIICIPTRCYIIFKLQFTIKSDHMEPLDVNKDLEKIIKEGFLEKQSRHIKSWRKRWFVLTPNTLYSFKEMRKYNSPTEALSLKSVSTIKSSDDQAHKEFSFKIDTPQRQFFMAAQNAQEKQMWIGQIGKAMVKLNVKDPQFD